MRSAFAHALLDLAAADERVVLLTGDLGFAVLEPFAERFPDRFWNVGVAEQNMVGLATGLAEAGYTPYVYSIATFASMRGYEAIRNGPLLHALPVRVVGVGGGMDYGHNGATHHALEDVAIMRAQPRMTLVAPADPAQTMAALSALRQLPGPCFLRLGKESTPVPGLDGRFRLGRAERIAGGDHSIDVHGEDVVIVALGGMASAAVAAADRLAAEGVAATVLVVSSLRPAPSQDIADALAAAPLALTVEDCYLEGALGSLVAETIAERALPCRLIRAGVRTMTAGASGSRAHLHERHGLGAGQLAATVRTALAADAPPAEPTATGAAAR